MVKDLIGPLVCYCAAICLFTAPRSVMANDNFTIRKVIQVSTDTGDWGDFKWNKISVDEDQNIIVAGVNGPWTNWYDMPLAKYSAAGDLIWKKTISMPGYDEALDLITDSTNNIYVAGISEDNNGNSAYVGKLDSDGNLLWSWRYGNNDTFLKEAASGITLDSNGNVYVCGWVAGMGAAEVDAFVAKLDNSGNQIWIKKLPGWFEDQANAIGVDGQGYIIVVGRTNGAINNGPVLRSVGYHGFIVKMDPDGALKSDMYLNSFSDITDLAIDDRGDVLITGTILAGEIKPYPVPPGPDVEDVLSFGIWHSPFSIFDDFVEGVPGYRVDFQPRISNLEGSFPEGIYTGRPSGGYEMDAFIAKLSNQLVPYYYKYFYDPTGLHGIYDYWSRSSQTCGKYDFCDAFSVNSFDVMFAREFGTSDHDQGLGIVLGPNGNSYVVGATNGNFLTGLSDQNDGYVAEFSGSDPPTTYQFGSDRNLYYRDDVATSMALGSNGTLYVAGYTNGSFTGEQVASIDGFIIMLAKTPTAIVSPVADPGANFSVKRLSQVKLDGTKSFDEDANYPLLYNWSFLSIPQGSTAILLDPQTSTPSFTTDLAGEYIIVLVVTDAQGNVSVPKTVTITAMNSVPVANAGKDQVVTSNGSTIQLDGSGSWDEDGDELAFKWDLIAPPASQASLSNSASRSPTFVIDVKGEYVARLTVTDSLDSSVDEVKISFDNLPPVAIAGSSESTLVGQLAALDGSQSYDPNNDGLSYFWSMIYRPEGSFAEIENRTAAKTQFIPDMPGEYRIALVVSDGPLESTPSEKSVIVIDQANATLEKLMLGIQAVNGLQDSSFANVHMRTPLVQKLIASTKMVGDGNFDEAKKKLNEDVMPKLDGCIKTGVPDKNDWLTECEDQALLYEHVLKALQILR